MPERYVQCRLEEREFRRLRLAVASTGKTVKAWLKGAVLKAVEEQLRESKIALPKDKDVKTTPTRARRAMAAK